MMKVITEWNYLRRATAFGWLKRWFPRLSNKYWDCIHGNIGNGFPNTYGQIERYLSSLREELRLAVRKGVPEKYYVGDTHV